MRQTLRASCARAISGHAAAAPLRSVMNSRRSCDAPDLRGCQTIRWRTPVLKQLMQRKVRPCRGSCQRYNLNCARMAAIEEGFERSEPRLQATTAAPRVAPAGPSCKDHLRLPYGLVGEPKRRARVARLLDIPSRHHIA